MENFNFEEKSQQIVSMAKDGHTREEIIHDLFNDIENPYHNVMQACFSAEFREKFGRILASNKRKKKKIGMSKRKFMEWGRKKRKEFKENKN